MLRRLTNRWWYAAAILILLLTGGYFWTNTKKIDKSLITLKEPVQNDVLPGCNKAVLTLGNGLQIILDSLHTGMLARQGNARIVNTDSGELAYTIAYGKQAAVVYNVLNTPRSEQYKIRLPDGTGVWLNSVSSITYPSSFADRERKVAAKIVVSSDRQPYRKHLKIPSGRWSSTKTLLVMKLTSIVILVASLHVNAHGFAQTVSFSGKNSSLEKVFESVKKQTG